MAFQVGNMVSPANTSAGLINAAPCVKGPLFGTVAAVAGTITVLWNDTGNLVATIPSTSLDLITKADDSALNALVGRRVQSTVPTGQTNWGIALCVDVYKRDNNTAGSPVQYALLQLESGAFKEVLAANCEAVNN